MFKPDYDYEKSHLIIAWGIVILSGFGIWKIIELIGGLL